MPEAPQLTAQQAADTIRSRPYIVLLIIVAVIGVIVSLASWGFLELIYQIQRELYTHLPHALGYDNGPPVWWPLPVLAIAGALVALAITHLPGEGGHLPARGLAPAGSAARPIDLPGVILAGIATIASGLVLGPEAPLIALGAGVAVLSLRAARREVAPRIALIVAAAGSFSALSFIFASPLVAAVILIEATGIGGAQLPVLLLPGLLAAGIGTLVSIGLGSFTGLSSSAYALGPLQLPSFGHPNVSQFGWTIALAVVIALVTRGIMLGGLTTHRFTRPRRLLLLPVLGLIIAGLAIAFSQATDKSVNEVLFSGQDALPGLVAQAGTWSQSALLLLILFKGIGYSLSLGAFRGGPTFPAIFLGAAAGVMASRLPGFALTPAVAVGIAAAVVSVLRLPLSAVVLGTLLTTHSGVGDEPLIIVGVVVAYIVTLRVSARPGSEEEKVGDTPAGAPPSQPAVSSPSPVN
jgi:H+/Cl- antiporter ClcA